MSEEREPDELWPIEVKGLINHVKGWTWGPGPNLLKQGCASVRPTRRHGPDWHGTVRHGADTARHGPAWRGLAWLIEVRGLANRSEGLANRSEGLGAGLARALSIKVKG